MSRRRDARRHDGLARRDFLSGAAGAFLGLGAQGVPSWGALLDQGAHYFLVTHHLATFPGVAIMISVLGINFVGDGLRDRLDPRRYEESA